MLLNGGNLVKPGKIIPSFTGIFASGKKNGIWSQGVIWVSTLYYRQLNPVFHLVQAWINPSLLNCPRSSLRFMRACQSCWVIRVSLQEKDFAFYIICTFASNEWKQPQNQGQNKVHRQRRCGKETQVELMSPGGGSPQRAPCSLARGR